ncbi:MAG: hypothetical protein J6T78_05830 [Bacteroidaceae bacterium]|nr:hypothetical protein [Bacteroidaceae bacterium]
MKKIQTNKRMVTLDGMMTFGQLENGLRIADFECCEDVQMEAYIAKCKVQRMRDGNVYITELPKRIRNKPMFRDDCCSLTLGHDGRFYFVFSMPEELVDELPQQLVRQASAIAQKVIRELLTLTANR